MPSTAASRSVTHSTPAARSPSSDAAVEPEAEEHERRDREEQHRRHGLERAQLELEVLAQQRADRPPHRYSPRTSASVDARRPAPRAPGARRAGRAPSRRRRGPPPRRGRSARAPARAAAARRPRRRPGRGWRAARRAAAGPARAARARQIAARWAMPRLSVRTGSSSRPRRPTRSDQRRRPLLGHVVQARVEAQVLAHGQVAVEQRLVAEQADPPAHLPRLPRQRRAEHARLARVRPQQPGEDPQQRRLARPVGAEHGDGRARRQREGARRAGRPARRRRARAPRPQPPWRWPWLDSPRSVATACSSTGAITGKSCSTAFGLPGKLTISVASEMPATPRVRMPERRVAGGLGAHRLGQPGRLAVDDDAGGLRRDVVGRHPGPARGEDEVAVARRRSGAAGPRSARSRPGRPPWRRSRSPRSRPARRARGRSGPRPRGGRPRWRR